MDRWTKWNWITLALIVGLIVYKAVNLEDPGHKCRWDLCPYKGVKRSGWEQAVTKYVGEDAVGSDSWCIDMLHLEFPEDEYEQLEDKLFKPMSK